MIALAPEHVHWVRRTHPEAADRTGTLRRLARDLPAHDAPLAERVASLDLAGSSSATGRRSSTPAGATPRTFAACAVEVVDLVAALAPRLVGPMTELLHADEAAALLRPVDSLGDAPRARASRPRSSRRSAGGPTGSTCASAARCSACSPTSSPTPTSTT